MILIERTIPKTCYDCPCTNDGFYRCLLEDKQLDDDCEQRRPTWCPLHEATADPDTVSRQAVLDAMASASQKAWDTLAVDDVRIVILSDAENAIKALTPSPSRPHGQWIPCTKNGLPLSEMAYRDGQKWYGYKCSNCTFIYKGNALTESPYCQKCGADMRQEGGAV